MSLCRLASFELSGKTFGNSFRREFEDCREGNLYIADDLRKQSTTLLQFINLYGDADSNLTGAHRTASVGSLIRRRFSNCRNG
jgi:hypothetical protein